MAVLLKLYCQKKLVNSTPLHIIAFFFIITAVTLAYADENDKENLALKGIISNPQTESAARKIGHFDIENGFERHYFYTLYQIGGKTLSRQGFSYYHFPISELKFPLDVYMFYLDINLSFIDRLTIHFSMHSSINTRVGKMKDSDWVPYPKIKTIYSESDARIKAVFNEIDLTARLFTVSFFSLKAGIGFMHQYMNYSCSNLEQISFYDSSSTTYIGNPSYIKLLGKALNYKIQYYFFTMQITPLVTVHIGGGALEIAAAIRFSPYIKAKDIDDHILRGKTSKGESTGTAFMPTLRIYYIFNTRIFITSKLEYMYLTTKGEQNQYYYNPFLDFSTGNIPGWSATIEYKTKSEQLSVSLGAGYSFEF